MTAQHWARHPMVDAVRQLEPTIRGLADRIEADRRLPQSLVDQLTEAQVFQMYLPTVMGGPEVHPLTGFSVCEELARVDGSVGWCAQVAAAVTVFLPWVDPEGLAEMMAVTDRPLHLAGSARPLGRGVRTDGGYRISGRWNFASGVAHANWFLATVLLDPVDDPTGSTAPAVNGDGEGAAPPVAKSMILPVEQGRIVANWDVVGMRGTGSDDFVIDDVEVPRRRSGARRWIAQRGEPLYRQELMMVATWAPTAGVAIGLARGAIEALAELGHKTSAGSPTPLRQRANVQEAMAESEAITSAARAFCVEAIEGAWQALLTGGDVQTAVARAQLAITHSMNEAVRVADICFHAAGTNAISTANRLERFLRDTHTAVQHAAGQPIHKRVAGRTLLGIDPGPLDPHRTGPSTPRR
ncbi:MAG: acyl-CoA dehydrogenase family protein [Acidimicrobiales bacterium]